MKTSKKIISFLILTFSLVILNSCENLTKCKGIEKSETLMLFDISDDKLFEEINTDLKSNFPHFMEQTVFANIDECQQAKMSLGTLSGRDELDVKSVSIGVLEKGLSGKEKSRRGNPTPAVNLVIKSLVNYGEMSKDKKYNTSTNILGTTVKGIIGMDTDAENTLIIFSDMVVNNKIEKINFYRKIPKDIKATVSKLIDPTLRDKLNNKLEEGLEIKIIVVLKNEQANKVKKKDVKAFWLKTFKLLKIDDVQFIDNLTNNIKLWDN